ncbi:MULTISPECIES: CocE/NonD family hydrolase [Streptomycetaceae]|uniref:CocE/NonD family hydrolase n=1 Tax=Streptomycetaceae TaxID=2062 RepID=UPI000213E533|nr:MULTISPECIES: CocE/NonD family hydrolase [Streptomycetaceae]MYS57363.1 acyl esterase [Streptomyces sp. SID5468]CCB72935.1 Acyl esterase [Streptantibioticus cattleyicolor NRRL 8057 = DSM 46488]
MTRTPRRASLPRRTAGAAALALAAATVTVTAPAARAAAPVFRTADITAKDGIVLKADVFTPAPGTPGADARGRYPAVVQPAAWGQPDLEYVMEGRRLAAEGYVAVTYTVRGFWLSGGEVDVAGAKDVADISTVTDWTLAHTPADPGRLGMMGLSLGAGLTLMGAAFEPRLKAVAAMSGWGDLTDSLDGADTRHLQAAAGLTAIRLPAGRPGPPLRNAVSDLFADRDIPGLRAWARTRSPSTYADRINAHGTAVLLQNAWGDSIFNSSQITAFYQRLTVPKRLVMRPGDHATQEAGSLFGLPGPAWSTALGWFDHHLKGAPDDTGLPVRLTVLRSGRQEQYAHWRDISTRTRRLPLAEPRTVTGGLDSGADAGTIEVSGLLDQVTGVPPLAEIPLLPATAAAVWQSPVYATTQHIRGIPRLHTTVTSSAPDGTAIAYLYDVNPLGLGALVTHAPRTWSHRPPGHPFPLDLALYATAYDLPAGHRLAVVIDTQDPLYASASPLGSTVTFTSRPGSPSELDVPLR